MVNFTLRFLPIECSTERLQHLASFAPWNISSTKIELFARSAILQGESSFIRSSPHRAKPVLSPSFVRINSPEGTPRARRWD